MKDIRKWLLVISGFVIGVSFSFQIPIFVVLGWGMGCVIYYVAVKNDR